MRVSAVGRRALTLAGVAGVFLATCAAAGAFTFTNFELAATPPQPNGTVCPDAGARCWNFAAEPAIRADPAGNFFASSENGLGGGTDAWRSRSGGLHYRTLPCPNCGSSANDSGFAPGGGDTDLAVAADLNHWDTFYNVYVASLTLGNVDVSTSKNGGRTWALNPVGALVSGDDREWIAADEQAKVCVSYHDVATFNLNVNCSFDTGKTFTQLGEAIDASHPFLVENNGSGNLWIDQSDVSAGEHNIYQAFSGIADASEEACGLAGTCPYHAVWVGVSTDGGRTFTDHRVHVGPNTKGYNHQFVSVATDAGGNVYVVYSDNHNVYMSFSTDFANTWSSAIKVNKGTAATAIFPWVTAGKAGKIDVVYYGSPYSQAGTAPDSFPLSASWRVYMAQNLSATGGGLFVQTAASPIVHYGGVCQGGISCTGNRDLYDDFGVAASPTTGKASIIYSDDQYRKASTSPPQPGCKQSTSNTPRCDHTSIATQTSGTGISS